MQGEGAEPQSGERATRLFLLALWTALALCLAVQHVPWRDEVRALTIALSGDTVFDMLRNLHGEGHPALWYLLLRGAHAIVPVPQIMPVLGFLIGFAAMAVLALRSPFRPATIALIMFGALCVDEFTVIARNYGMTALVLFAIASLYRRHRDRGFVLGVLLALLCNTNVQAVLIAAALLGFWLVELIAQDGLRWTGRHWHLLGNAGIAAIGVLLCFLQVYPPAHDAAAAGLEGNFTFASIATAIATPANSFSTLLPTLLWQIFLTPATPKVMLAILLFGAMLGLLHRPAALLSALGLYLALTLFFHLVYPGSYRHQGLFLIHLVTLYWLVANGGGGSWRWAGLTRSRYFQLVVRAGGALFILLLALQMLTMLWRVSLYRGDLPWSRAYDVSQLLEREGLTEAIVMADEDIMVEPLPYYVDNPLYLPRERRFGAVFAFDRHPRNDLTLGDLLDDARDLSERHGRPVVLLLVSRPKLDDPPRRLAMLQTASFSITPDQVRRLQAEGRMLASFGQAATGESYDVYLLPGSAPVRP